MQLVLCEGVNLPEHHRDLELLTSTSYTAVGSGFDLQGVPAEKPRNLLTQPQSESVGLLGLLLQCENIYLGPLKWCTGPLHLHIPYFLDYSAPLFSSRPRIDRALCPGLVSELYCAPLNRPRSTTLIDYLYQTYV